MSFAYTIKITYEKNYGLSLQQLGEAFSQEWLPATINSVCYENFGKGLKIVFLEHDNEEFMAGFIAENLILINSEGDPLKKVKVKSVEWDGLDKHLSDYYLRKLGMPGGKSWRAELV